MVNIERSFSFNPLDEYEKPIMTLCNPQRNELCTLGITTNCKLSLVFNGLSEFSFSISEKAPYYDLVVKNRIVHLEGIGHFIITGTNENDNGLYKTKDIECYSYEYVLNRQPANLADGTYAFYNPVSPDDTLLHKVVKQIPLWKIGYVSSELWSKFRTFEINDTPLYGFLMTDVSDAYECVFKYDVENFIINAYSFQEATTKTDIFLSNNNLVKSKSIKTTDDDILTGISVIGDSTLDISLVNPMGTSIIYNFDYIKSPDWMTQGLIDALDNWETLFDSYQEQYADYLSDLKTVNIELIRLNSELVDIETEYKVLETQRTERIVQGISDLSSITNQINQVNSRINDKKNEIASKKADFDRIQDNLKAINESLQFKKFMTDEQLLELDSFMVIGTYQNENFGVLDSMTPVEEQELAQQLYDQGKDALNRLSQPNYTFDNDVINFLFIRDYKDTFIKQIELGCTVNLEIRDDVWIEPVLLKMDINYDNPTDFKMTFSNKLRLNTAEWTYAELMNKQSKASNKVSVSGIRWNEAANKSNEISDYMSGSLNLVNQSIQSTENQETSIDQFGIWSRQIESDGSFSPYQMRITNNVMAFTRDNWQSCIAAFGKIPNPTGTGYTYGLIAPALVGNLIAGNTLIISNQNNSFKVDGSGATLYNAVLSIVRKDNRAKILLDPDDGIRIQTNTGSGFVNSFYVDTAGKIVANDIITNRGTIGGWSIQTNGLFAPFGDYIRSDGYVKLGMLTMTPSSATFNGVIYARNLGDYVQNNNIANYAVDQNKLDSYAVSTDKIQTGAVTPTKLDRVYATELYVDNLVANKASITELNAVKATITNLSGKFAEFSQNISSMTMTTSTLAVDTTILCHGNLVTSSFNFNQRRVSWKTITVSGETFRVLADTY